MVFSLWVFVVWFFRFLFCFLSCLCFRFVYLWGVVFVYFGGKELFCFFFLVWQFCLLWGLLLNRVN